MEVRNLTDEDGDEVILYAIWQATHYRIIFDANGRGKTGDDKKEVTVVVEKDVPFVFDNYFYTSANICVFGYSTAKNASKAGTHVYEVGDSVINLIESGSIRLYAQWRKLTGVNGSSGRGNIPTIPQSQMQFSSNYVSMQMSAQALAFGKVHNEVTPGVWVYEEETDTWRYSTTLDILNGANGNVGYTNMNYITDGYYKLGKEEYMYHFDENGVMTTGFIAYAGNVYYAEEIGRYKGALVTGSWIIDGIAYTFNDHGELEIPEDHIWTVVEDGQWFFNMYTGRWMYIVKRRVGGTRFLSQAMYRIKDITGTYQNYMFDEYGQMMTGFQNYAEKMRYFRESGELMGAEDSLVSATYGVVPLSKSTY